MIQLNYLWILIGLLALVTLGVVMSIVLLRWQKTRYALLKKKHTRRVQVLLSYLLVHFDNTKEKEFQEKLALLQSKLTDRIVSRVMIQEMYRMSEILHGDEKENLRQVFLILGLHSAAIQKLNSKSIKKRLDGIKMLSYFQVKGTEAQLSKLVSDKVPAVRSAAIIASIQFQKNPLSFFALTKLSLTQWEMINIQVELENIESARIPQFKTWLDHQSTSVVKFCIQMIGQYRQMDSEKELISLIENTTNMAIYDLILDLICQLGLDALIPALIQKSGNISTKQTEILIKSLHVLGELSENQESMDFCIEMLSHPSRQVKSAALTNLSKIGYYSQFNQTA